VNPPSDLIERGALFRCQLPNNQIVKHQCPGFEQAQPPRDAASEQPENPNFIWDHPVGRERAAKDTDADISRQPSLNKNLRFRPIFKFADGSTQVFARLILFFKEAKEGIVRNPK